MIKLENYNIDKGIAPSRLKRLSDKSLNALLNEWSRVGNARAKRLSKSDPSYSAVFRYNKEGKFGTKDTYKSRESMIQEITRIKETAPQLRVSKARAETKEIDNIIEKIKQSAKVSDPLEDGTEEVDNLFRQAFAMFRDGHGQVAIDFYDNAKAIRETITSGFKSKYQMEAMIIRMYEKYEKTYTSQKEELKGFTTVSDDEDLPF